MNPLFDQIPRDYEGPSGNAETVFDYLNRSARESSARVRGLLEDWLARYPAGHRAELCRRLQTPSEHQSASFELFLHELLLTLGCGIGLHPVLEVSSRSPDFQVHEERADWFL